MKKRILIILSIFASISFSKAQDVPQQVSNVSIYEFLNELANIQVIDLNTAVKPYSRNLIAEKLSEAGKKSDQLNKRQKDELAFFLKDYSKELPSSDQIDYPWKRFTEKPVYIFARRFDLFYYRDSLFSISINPVLGYNYFTNANGSNYHRWNGADAFAYIGKHWGFYSSLRDNHESELFCLSNYLTPERGGTFKTFDGGGDYEEVKGGITYAWKWGSVGLAKDNIIWGNNYHGANILSDRAPSFPYIKLHLSPVKWFDFNYFHGWLVSRVIDSLRTYHYNDNGERIIYRQKYIAANMFTFTPFKNLKLSFGNSVIYSDIGVQPGFLIPLVFFKSVDHSMNGMNNNAGQNAQMFFDISSRQIKHLHLYTSIFVDEINTGNMWDEAKQTNFVSLKGGFAISDFPLQNIELIAEYTRTNPIAYKHFISTTVYSSNLFCLGHYLRDNAEEIYVALRYKPYRSLHIQASYTLAEKGPDYPYTGVNHKEFGLPWMSNVFWENRELKLSADYEIFNDIRIFAGYTIANIQDTFGGYTPEFYKGKTKTLNLGFNWGF